MVRWDTSVCVAAACCLSCAGRSGAGVLLISSNSRMYFGGPRAVGNSYSASDSVDVARSMFFPGVSGHVRLFCEGRVCVSAGFALVCALLLCGGGLPGRAIAAGARAGDAVWLVVEDSASDELLVVSEVDDSDDDVEVDGARRRL